MQISTLKNYSYFFTWSITVSLAFKDEKHHAGAVGRFTV